MSQTDIQSAVEALKRWRENPVSFVRECLKAEPDAWQRDVLEAFPYKPRQAMTACKGPGKSTVLAWLALNFLCTRVDSKVVAVSATADTLSDTLWREIAYWHSKSDLLKQCFRVSATSIESVERPKTWSASARSYPRQANPQQQADALAGIHGQFVLFLLDEAGSIPRAVLATAEAVLAGEGDQHVVMAGNPTNQDSALGFAVLNQRHLWDVHEITGDPDDPKRSPRVPVQWARQQIDAWGRDNPWVLVNVFGRFPPAGLNTLITPDEVRDAQKRHYPDNAFDDYPLIIGADVARFGDDETVFFPRRGKISYPPLRMRNLDGVQIASHLANISAERKADSVQIDASGGFGTILDVYRSMAPNGLPVTFGGDALEKRRFRNKRAEIVWKCAEWVKDGARCRPFLKW